MDTDIALVLGVVFAALAFPALLSAFSESRAPRAAALMGVLSAGLVYFAVDTRPGGYQMDDIPGAFARVIGRIAH
ncbi:hypothetical protein [Oceaniglobus roseus]|uniref:hypothetical protein n=1 Tax=Oceaniglobus roseus TaxID=1737570 RepID=UPI000C7EBE93|nr:hypothetical protein [Kandeliimicrobium roseum]